MSPTQHDIPSSNSNGNHIKKLPESPPSSNTNNDKCMKFCFELLGAYGALLILGAFVTVVVAAVYGFIGIINVSNQRVREICPDSNLWSFVLVWVVMVFCNLLIAGKTNKDDSGPCLAICSLAMSLALIIWGAIELWDIASDCDSLHKKNLYLSATLIIITHLTLFANLLLGFVGYSIGLCIFNINEKKQIKKVSQIKDNSQDESLSV